MSALGTTGSRGAADRNRVPAGSQAERVAAALGAALLLGWLALSLARGGVDLGSPTSADPWSARGAAGFSVIAILIAGGAYWRTRAHPAWRSLPFALAGLGSVGITAWAAASIGWSAAPDLAWIEANQLALSTAVMIAAIGLATTSARPGPALAVGISAFAAPVVLLALAGEVWPAVFGSDFEPGRLSGSLDSPNALATIIALAIPGALWLGARNDRWWLTPLAAAWIALLVTALAMSLSRSGILAALIAAALTIPALRSRTRGALAAVAGLIGAVAPIGYALSHDVLTEDRVPIEMKDDAGAVLGGLLALGVVVAVLIASIGVLRISRRSGAAGLAALIVVALAVPLSLGATPGAPPPDRDAIANDPGRVLSVSSNNRLDWWSEAIAGWQEHPLIGNGAGSFAVVHLQQRDDGDDRFNVRQPHQIALKALSDLGVIGLGLLLLIAMAALISIARLMRRGEHAQWALPTAVLAAFVVEAQLDVSLSVPALSAPAFAAIGVLVAQAARPGGEKTPGGETAIAALCAMVAVAAIAAALFPALAAERTREANDALLAGDLGRAISVADNARELNPLSTAPLDVQASAYGEERNFGAMVAQLREATEIQPDNPRVWRRLAVVLDGLGDPDVADTWTRVAELDPLNRGARAALDEAE